MISKRKSSISYIKTNKSLGKLWGTLKRNIKSWRKLLNWQRKLRRTQKGLNWTPRRTFRRLPNIFRLLIKFWKIWRQNLQNSNKIKRLKFKNWSSV